MRRNTLRVHHNRLYDPLYELLWQTQDVSGILLESHDLSTGVEKPTPEYLLKRLIPLTLCIGVGVERVVMLKLG